MITIDFFQKCIVSVFCADTAKSGYKWSPTNPTAGQCAVCALLAQDYFGGDIAKIKVKSSTHYFNIIDGNVIDCTSQQFLPLKPDYSHPIICDRKKMLKTIDTKNRYNMLKQLFEKEFLLWQKINL